MTVGQHGVKQRKAQGLHKRLSVAHRGLP